ncbi:MAG: hypothetical protein PHW43_05225 [Syntrophales bacterium]|nr:hypothetical protein [Syntrophales bacterium]
MTRERARQIEKDALRKMREGIIYWGTEPKLLPS